MHEAERLFTAPCRACFQLVERAFIAIYKNPLCFIIGAFEASPQPPQNDRRMYQLFSAADFHLGCKLVPCRDNALTDLPDAMSITVARPFKVQN